MKEFYFHITKPKNKKSILSIGLISDENNEIFVFDNILVADNIAMNQLGLNKYAVFKIDSKGIQEEPLNDNVAEFSAKNQFIIKQSKIESKFIEFIEIKEINDDEFYLKENIKLFSLTNPRFKNSTYKEQVLIIANIFKKVNKEFYNFLIEKANNLN